MIRIQTHGLTALLSAKFILFRASIAVRLMTRGSNKDVCDSTISLAPKIYLLVWQLLQMFCFIIIRYGNDVLIYAD